MIDMITTKALAKAVELAPTNHSFFRDNLFTSRFYASSTVLFDVKRGNMDLAPYADPRLEAPITTRDGFVTKEFRTAYVKIKEMITEADLEMRGFNEKLFKTKEGQQKIANLLKESTSKFKQMLKNREEAMCVESLKTGKLIVTTQSNSREIDFDRNPDHTAINAGTAQWTDANSSPISDITQDVRKIRINGHGNATALFGNPYTLSVLIKHNEVRELLDNRRIILGQIDPKKLTAKGTAYYGTLAIEGAMIDLYSYVGAYTKDGTRYEYFEDGEVLLVDETQKQDFWNAPVLNPKSVNAKGTYVSKWPMDDPAGIAVMLESNLLSTLKYPDVTAYRKAF
jgi:hypothetical protein